MKSLGCLCALSEIVWSQIRVAYYYELNNDYESHNQVISMPFTPVPLHLSNLSEGNRVWKTGWSLGFIELKTRNLGTLHPVFWTRQGSWEAPSATCTWAEQQSAPGLPECFHRSLTVSIASSNELQFLLLLKQAGNSLLPSRLPSQAASVQHKYSPTGAKMLTLAFTCLSKPALTPQPRDRQRLHTSVWF